MKPKVLGLIMFLSITIFCFPQEKKVNQEFTFMFYNTENFFDCENDSTSQDDEFTPKGDRRWNYSRLHLKADHIAKVLLAAGKWNAPVVIGLCEIESQLVLEILTKQTPLNKFGYKIIHKDSPDNRGIDVAMIYRNEIFKPYAYKAISVIDSLNSNFKTRDILLVSGILNNCDTIHFLVNHWPSRYGGIMETFQYRSLAAGILKKSIQKLFSEYPKARIICMGDFNDTPQDQSLLQTLNAVKTDDPETSGEMINLSFKWMDQSIQTIKNVYSWQVFDQWIVSDYFTKSNKCIKFDKVEIFDDAFLLEPDKKYGGVKPKRSYIGYKYQDGFSDHLPILLRFSIQNY